MGPSQKCDDYITEEGVMWHKACPKCRGDLLYEQGADEDRVYCLQCGRELSAAERARIGAPASSHKGFSISIRELMDLIESNGS